jgi:hypothetical protein
MTSGTAEIFMTVLPLRTIRTSVLALVAAVVASDDWYGKLYHLNAEEEPEQLDKPDNKNPEFKQKYAPRGVLYAWTTNADDPTEDPVSRRAGRRRIENTGPLTRTPMETFDGEVLDVTLNYLDEVGKGDNPFSASRTTPSSSARPTTARQPVDHGWPRRLDTVGSGRCHAGS